MFLRSVARLLCLGLLVSMFSAGAFSQATQTTPPSVPEYESADEMGVDLFSGRTSFKVTDLAIGSLSHTLMSTDNGFSPFAAPQDSFSGSLTTTFGQRPAAHVFTFGSFNERFLSSDGITFATVTADGSTLAQNADGSSTLTARDGTTYHLISSTGPACNLATSGCAVDKVTHPDGRSLSLYYKPSSWRLQSVVSNEGWQIKYNYNGSGYLVGVVGINNAVEYCDPYADSCTLANAWPTTTYSLVNNGLGTSYTYTVTDAAGRVTRYTEDKYGQVTAVKPPSSPSADIYTYTYCAWPQDPPYNCFITNSSGTTAIGKYMTVHATANGALWQYNWTTGIGCCWGGGGSYSQYQSTNPVGVVRQSYIQNSYDQSWFLWLHLASGGSINFSGLLDVPLVGSVVSPEGITTSYTYDGRRNVTQTTSGSGSTTAVVTAGYDTTCANPVTCNKPNWVRDAKGNQTDYTYDPTHGGVLTVTGPADIKGIRPQTRYHYIQRYAWVKSASGSYVQASSPIYLLSYETFCRTGAASGDGCAIAGDEIRTTYEYGANSGPNNLLLRGKVVTGDGQTLRACYSYDRFGHKLSETKPRAGLISCP